MNTIVYILAYLVVGVVLAVGYGRKSVYDEALALVLFWPFFAVLAMSKIIINSFIGLPTEIHNRMKPRMKK